MRKASRRFTRSIVDASFGHRNVRAARSSPPRARRAIAHHADRSVIARDGAAREAAPTGDELRAELENEAPFRLSHLNGASMGTPIPSGFFRFPIAPALFEILVEIVVWI